MKVLVGTSGWAFKEWKGAFYPGDLKDDAMLTFYSGRYPTVEINNTFYRMPKEKVLLDWAESVPATFTFALKASQRITHFARLRAEAADSVDFFLRNTSLLGSRLGPVLFQCPPNFQKDLARLRGFLGLLPSDRRFAMEFRHESWYEDDVLDALRERNVAFCIAEGDDVHTPLHATATWGYLRLHRFDYDEAKLAEWATRVAAQEWTEAYVFFKHDHTDGSGPPAVDGFSRTLAQLGAVRA
jgi:uncharacterized protein YecE (DUF72 family)